MLYLLFSLQQSSINARNFQEKLYFMYKIHIEVAYGNNNFYHMTSRLGMK